MKISEAPMKELYLGRKLKLLVEGHVGVICGLKLEIPPVRHVLGGSVTKQVGPRYSTIDIYSITTRSIHQDIFISASNIELLDETLDTKDLYDLARK